MDRIKALRKVMRNNNIDAFVVTHLPHIRYFTGFSGSSATLVILPRSVHFFTDGRYTTQVETELYDIKKLETHITRNPWQVVAEQSLVEKGQTIAFQGNVVTVDQLKAIRKQLKGVKCKAMSGVIEPLVQPKTADEVKSIRKAAAIGDKVYAHILDFVKPGMTEMQVSAEISYQAALLGSEGDAFDIIVASGERSALPHGRASQKKIRKGELVTLDFGCIVDGLCSDMTRTFGVGKLKKQQKEIYSTVLKSMNAGIKCLKPNILAKDADAVSRGIIADAGYGKYFTHSLGHGLGIDVHEGPGLAPAAGKNRILENTVVTVEPGIYIPGKYGVRIENDVWVTKKGNVVLNEAPTELICV